MSKYCYSCMCKIKGGDIKECPICNKPLSRETPPHHLPAGTVLKNRYVVGYSIGEGGFGITYIGHDTILDMKVAIKEFYPAGFVDRSSVASNSVFESSSPEPQDFFEKGKERFLSEARILARFSGYNGIASVRDFFDDNNTAYMVMEYIDGITLSDHLKRNGIIPYQKAIQMLTPIMYALKEIHSQKIIHCDISLKNIMICKDGKVKLLDFGAAKMISGLSNRSTPIMLSSGFAPEEQYRANGEQGPWTDVYSLCAVLYRCITGIMPIESIKRLANDTLIPPLDLNCGIDAALNRVLMKGLAVHHEDRFSSIEQLMSALSCPLEQAESKTADTVQSDKAFDDDKTVFVPDQHEENSPDPKTDHAETHNTSQNKVKKYAPPNSAVSHGAAVKKKISRPLIAVLCSLAAVIIASAILFFFGFKVTICGESYWGGSTYLELSDKVVTTADIVEISRMPFLRSVSFSRCSLHNLSKDIEMSTIFRVNSLSFTNTGGGIDYLLYNLPHKEALQSLKIDSCGEWLSGNLFIDFQRMPRLKNLKLSYLSYIDVLSWESASQLESFADISAGVSTDYSKRLQYCENLKEVILNDCYVGNIDFIEKLPKLEYLDVSNSYVTNIDFIKTFEKASGIEIHTDEMLS